MFGALVLVFLSVLAGGTSVAVAAAAWNQRHRPGGGWFALLMGGVSLWSLSYGVALLVEDPGLRFLFEYPMELAQAIIAPAWLLFALAYTGRDGAVTRRAAALLGVVPIVTFGLLATNASHHLLWTDYAVVPTVGATTVLFDPGPWFYVHAVYGYVLVGAGLAFLLDMLGSSGRLYSRQVVALVVGALVSTVAHVAHTLQLGPYPQLNLTPIALAVTGLVWAYALFRFELLDRAPATSRLGLRGAIDDVGVGVAVVDPEGRVVEVNQGARSVLGPDCVGESLTSLVPVSSLPTADPEVVSLDADGATRLYELTGSPVADRRGQLVARTVSFRDVTRRERQRQRLEVLNRVLRHNLRNEMTVVLGYAETLADDLDEPHAGMANTVETRSRRLLELGERAREVGDVLDVAGEDAEPVDLRAVVRSVVDRNAKEGPATVAVESPDERRAAGADGGTDADGVDDDETTLLVPGPRRTVEAIVENLVENAVTHGGSAPHVAVDVRTAGEGAVVTVADDGAGIPAHELAPLDAGGESALEHGSGIGLWLVHWGVTSLGGSVAFDVSDGGTTVRVRLPRVST